MAKNQDPRPPPIRERRRRTWLKKLFRRTRRTEPRYSDSMYLALPHDFYGSQRSSIDNQPTDAGVSSYSSSSVTVSALESPTDNTGQGVSQLVYLPLLSSSGSMRLLKILRGSLDNPLQCHMMHADFCNAMYETVSYCWGNKSNTALLDVDGKYATIPLAAAKALRQLRNVDHDRVVWLDSVCINQGDISERNQQVAKMHDIYSHGKCNLIWLGSDDGTVTSAMDTIQAIMKEIRTETNNFSTFESTLRSPSGQLRLSCKPWTLAIDVEPVLRLFARPWFSRMWVVQEVSLAASNQCHCGPHEFNFSDLLRTASWLYHKKVTLPTDTLGQKQLNEHMVNAALLANFCDPDFGWFRKASIPTSPHGVLFPLLNNLASFETRYPQDRVFGLLGLYHHLKTPSEPEPLLRVDYEKPFEDVFRDATRQSINETCRLESLSWVQHRLHGDPNYQNPTWVPQWHRKCDVEQDARLLPTFFDASQSRPADVKLLSSYRDSHLELSVSGLFVDGRDGCAVSGLSYVCTSSSALPGFFRQAEELWHGLPSKKCCDEIDFATTLIVGRNAQNEAATSEFIKGFRGFEDDLKALRNLPPRKPRPRIGSEQSWSLRDPPSQFWEACWNACHRRRFFTTESGRIGLGPQVMQTGDIVVVLYGGQWPFVLRLVSDSRLSSTQYEVVGQCYVHDVMFGEAVEQHEAAGEEDVRFDLV